MEHKLMSWEDIATTTVDVEQFNTMRVNIHKSQERKTCTHTKQSLHKDDYRYFQLKEFVGRSVFKLTPYFLYSFDEKQIGMLQVCRNITMKEIISWIKN